jgi:hypothetical protein
LMELHHAPMLLLWNPVTTRLAKLELLKSREESDERYRISEKSRRYCLFSSFFSTSLYLFLWK